MVTHYLLLQYGMKEEINLFGERDVREVWKDI